MRTEALSAKRHWIKKSVHQSAYDVNVAYSQEAHLRRNVKQKGTTQSVETPQRALQEPNDVRGYAQDF